MDLNQLMRQYSENYQHIYWGLIAIAGAALLKSLVLPPLLLADEASTEAVIDGLVKLAQDGESTRSSVRCYMCS